MEFDSRTDCGPLRSRSAGFTRAAWLMDGDSKSQPDLFFGPPVIVQEPVPYPRERAQTGEYSEQLRESIPLPNFLPPFGRSDIVCLVNFLVGYRNGNV
jgi:hypothetical protein